MFHWTYSVIISVAARLQRKAVDRIWIRPLFEGISHNATILEIGGGYRPRFTKGEYPNVFHLDHATAEDLRKKYSNEPVACDLVENIQPVDFVSDGSPIEDLIPEELKFDVIFSSHAIEHQVDLIGHFISIEKLLKVGGRVIMLIPDYRCTFDALRFPTVVGEAITVHRRGGKIHRGRQIFGHISRTIDVNPNRKVRSFDLAAAQFNWTLGEGLEATKRCDQPGAAYEDAHAWVFCPLSFRLLLLELYMLGYTCLQPTAVSYTYGNQFCAVLERDEPYAGSTVEKVHELERERLTLSMALRH